MRTAYRPSYVVKVDPSQCPIGKIKNNLMLLSQEDLALMQEMYTSEAAYIADVNAANEAKRAANPKAAKTKIRDLLNPLGGLEIFGIVTDGKTVQIVQPNGNVSPALAENYVVTAATCNLQKLMRFGVVASA